MCAYSLNEYRVSQIVLTIESKVVSRFWARSPISFKYLRYWRLVYTMDYEVGPWKMAFSHGSILKKPACKAFGPLTRCKPNVDQEEWPCTKK